MTAQPKHPKEACPHCGTEVSTYPLTWKGHMKKCPKNPVNEQPAETVSVEAAVEKVLTDEPPVQQKATEPPSQAEAVIQEAQPKQEAPKLHPDLAKAIARAEARENQLLETPELITSEDAPDARMQMRIMYAPETLDEVRDSEGKLIKEATRHCFFGHPKDMNTDINRGYVPKAHPDTGELLRLPGRDGLIMYTQDMRIKQMRDKALSDASAANLKRSREKMEIHDKVREGDSQLDKHARVERSEHTRGAGV